MQHHSDVVFASQQNKTDSSPGQGRCGKNMPLRVETPSCEMYNVDCYDCSNVVATVIRFLLYPILAMYRSSGYMLTSLCGLWIRCVHSCFPSFRKSFRIEDDEPVTLPDRRSSRWKSVRRRAGPLEVVPEETDLEIRSLESVLMTHGPVTPNTQIFV